MNKKDFYIFLDIDGVFNSYGWAYHVKKNKLEEKGYHEEFCPDNLKIFNKMLKEIRNNNFEPKIILSSDWRKERLEEAVALFKKYGIDYEGEYDKTGIAKLIPPDKEGMRRASEIASYCEANEIDLKDSFIIIDDKIPEIRRYMYILHPSHFLQTSGKGGAGLNDDNFKTFKEINLPQLIHLSSEEESVL
jgi:hypothetical protein